MLLTLKHLLVLILALAVVVCVVGLTGGFLPPMMAVAIAVLTLALITSTLWPVFKLLNLRPLILPRCPSCGRRHGNYHIPRNAWPNPIIVCYGCGAPLRLDLVKAGRAESDIPSVSLRFPRFIGLWVRVDAQR